MASVTAAVPPFSFLYVDLLQTGCATLQQEIEKNKKKLVLHQLIIKYRHMCTRKKKNISGPAADITWA